MNNNWREIWEKHCADGNILQGKDEEKIFMELKRSNGYDVIGGGRYEWWIEMLMQIKQELFYTGNRNIEAVKSVYEVGCGSGANLYLFEKEGIQFGGIDNTKNLLDSAKKILSSDDLI